MKIFGMYIGHDSNYAVIEDGKIKVHNEFERFSRVKHDFDYSYLRENGMLEDNAPFFNHVKELEDFKTADIITAPVTWADSTKTNTDTLMGHFEPYKDKFMLVGHNEAHAANAYYSSPYQDAIVFTNDGGGWEGYPYEWSSLGVYGFKENKSQTLYKGSSMNVSTWWAFITSDVLGMGTVHSREGDQAGSTMAMAALGDPYKYLHLFNGLSYMKPFEDTDLRTELQQTFSDIIQSNGEQSRFDIAASLQLATEQFIRILINTHIDSFDSKNVGFSGGTFLNCVALGKIAKELIDRGYNVFCDHAPHDGGLGLGSAKLVWYDRLNNERLPLTRVSLDDYINRTTPYLGITYDSSEIINEITQSLDTVDGWQDVSKEQVVDLLIDGKIISLYNGGSESGKRALGNRSIVADPRNPNMKDMINQKVKHRQNYRPFAPSILREKVGEWFEFDIDSPYMSFAIPFKEEKKKEVPAVVHVDGTARLQTVKMIDNKDYYELIKLFDEKTGVPMLLNTSFNDREPIVETPKQAIQTFLGTDIDYLYFVTEKILLKKK